MNEIDDRILDDISDLYVDCPACKYMTDDDQYTCTKCWHEGGNGKIRVYDFLEEYFKKPNL
jgi:hypothetical protein